MWGSERTESPPKFGEGSERSWGELGDVPPLELETDAIWEYDAGGEVVASPAVVDGTVYLGSGDGTLRAIEAGTGTEIWSEDFLFGVSSAPAVVDGSVYATTLGGTVVAVDASTGDRLWTFEREGSFLSTVGFTPSPLVAGDHVVVGMNDGTVYALDPESGEPIWSFATDDQIIASPVLYEDAVLVASSDETIYSLGVEDGALRWSKPLEGLYASSPTIDGDRAYVGTEQGELYALDPESGTIVWNTGLDWTIHSTPTVASGTVFTSVTQGPSELLVAVDAETGDRLWDQNGGSSVSSPSAVGDTVYVGTNGGSVYGFDTEAGTLTEVFRCGEAVTASPVVVNGTVFVADSAGTLYAVDATESGSSVGSRVRDGSRGHNESLQSSLATGAAAGAPTPEDPSGSEAGGAADELAGPGILGSVTSLLGAKLLLDRSQDDDSPDR